jgi:hypothetical protein
MAGLAMLVVKGPVELPGRRRRVTTDDTTPALVLDDLDDLDGDEDSDRRGEPEKPVPVEASSAGQAVSSERQT